MATRLSLIIELIRSHRRLAAKLYLYMKLSEYMGELREDITSQVSLTDVKSLETLRDTVDRKLQEYDKNI